MAVKKYRKITTTNRVKKEQTVDLERGSVVTKFIVKVDKTKDTIIEIY